MWVDEARAAAAASAAPPAVDAKILDQVRAVCKLLSENIGSVLKLEEIKKKSSDLFEGLVGEQIARLDAEGKSFQEILNMLHADAVAMELRGAAPPEQATAPRTDSLEASAAESQVSNASQPSQPVASVSGDDAVLSEASAAKPGASSAAKPLANAPTAPSSRSCR